MMVTCNLKYFVCVVRERQGKAVAGREEKILSRAMVRFHRYSLGHTNRV